MYELKIISQFAAAHQLREFKGGCEKLHGHNWKVEVCVCGEKLGDDGLVMDFRLIKTHAKEVLDELDHTFLNDLEPFARVNPSSENIARHIFRALGEKLNGKRARVSSVSAWESDSSCATYREP